LRIIRSIAAASIMLLAIIGGFTVVAYFAPQRYVAAPTPDHIKFVGSPDGKLKAAVLTFAGGGALSPFCYEKVAIIPASATDHEVTDNRFEVYSGPCHGFAPRNDIIEPSPRLDWLSDTALRITISINATAVQPIKVDMKKQDASGKVRIEFLAHD
jgi:hypothetical protein